MATLVPLEHRVRRRAGSLRDGVHKQAPMSAAPVVHAFATPSLIRIDGPTGDAAVGGGRRRQQQQQQQQQQHAAASDDQQQQQQQQRMRRVGRGAVSASASAHAVAAVASADGSVSPPSAPTTAEADALRVRQWVELCERFLHPAASVREAQTLQLSVLSRMHELLPMPDVLQERYVELALAGLMQLCLQRSVLSFLALSLLDEILATSSWAQYVLEHAVRKGTIDPDWVPVSMFLGTEEMRQQLVSCRVAAALSLCGPPAAAAARRVLRPFVLRSVHSDARANVVAASGMPSGTGGAFHGEASAFDWEFSASGVYVLAHGEVRPSAAALAGEDVELCLVLSSPVPVHVLLFPRMGSDETACRVSNGGHELRVPIETMSVFCVLVAKPLRGLVHLEQAVLLRRDEPLAASGARAAGAGSATPVDEGVTRGRAAGSPARANPRDRSASPRVGGGVGGGGAADSPRGRLSGGRSRASIASDRKATVRIPQVQQHQQAPPQ